VRIREGGNAGGLVDALTAVAAAGLDRLRRVDADADRRSEAVASTVVRERLLDRDGS
jgi:hypothetical protein